jgi:hypothetical protein
MRREKELQIMPLPKIEGASRRKPLCYDPSRKKFILFDEIVSGKEKIIPLDTLSEEDLKRLVIERQRQDSNYTVQAISGPPHGRDSVIKAIEQDDPFGQTTVKAEVSYLKELLNQIQRNLAAVR